MCSSRISRRFDCVLFGVWKLDGAWVYDYCFDEEKVLERMDTLIAGRKFYSSLFTESET